MIYRTQTPILQITTSGGSSQLVASNSNTVLLNGTMTHTIILPDVTTMFIGLDCSVWNLSTQSVTIESFGSNILLILAPQTGANFFCKAITGTDGSPWIMSMLPTLGQLVGTMTNDTAGFGVIGETQIISRLRSNALSISNATPVNVGTTTGITLDGGNYLGYAMVGFKHSGILGTVTELDAAVSMTSATLPASDTIANPTNGEVWITQGFAGIGLAAKDFCIQIIPFQINIPAGTMKTFYLVASASFTLDSVAVYGSFMTIRSR
jgi:hypothetical protein